LKTLSQKLAELHAKIDDLVLQASEVEQLIEALRGHDHGVELLTERAISSEFNISIKTLQNWRSSKPRRGPAYHKAGRKVLYKRSDILAFLRAH
jgi:hypothetical protein